MTKLTDFMSKIFITNSLTNDTFQHLTIRRTAGRGIYFSLAIIIVELLMIVASFVLPRIYNLDNINLYRLHYLFLLVFSSIGIILIKHYIKKDPHEDRMLYIITVLYLFIIILWGGSITLLDLRHNPQITVYLSFVLLISIAPLIPPHIMLSIYMISHTIFLILVPFYQSSPELILSTRLNSTIFIFFAWIISRHLYRESYTSFLKDQLIESQNNDLISSNLQLHKISRQDPLTNLHNRLSLDSVLSNEWSKAIENDELLSVLMIDIDSFKVFNDTYGHIIGDKCIVKVAEKLNEVASNNLGTAFRYGGDEFCILIRNLSDHETTNLINYMYSLISDLRISVNTEHEVSINLTIGYCCEPAKLYSNPWHLINLADQDLYKNKSLK